jgi:hypothetical protein
MTDFLPKTILTFVAALIAGHGSMTAAAPEPSGDPKPRLYLTQADVTRLRDHAGRPELAAAYADLEAKSKKSVDQWRKKYPATATPPSTGELLEIGKRDNPFRDYKAVAAAYALHPARELGEVLREKLVATIGARQVKNFWRGNDGIHEGEVTMDYLETYDIASGAGLLTPEDQKEIKEAMHQAGHLLEGWVLDRWSSDDRCSQTQTDIYGNTYCLNFEVFATSVMGTIAMLYPDLPESSGWLREAQEELPKLLFTEFGLDGGYGEGTLHYWHPTFRALLGFMVASRNFGVRDYFADPSVADAMRRTLAWRMDLTEPDGLSLAVGDAHRDMIGAESLIEAGKILNEPGAVWVGRSIIERARPGMIPGDPYDLFQYDMGAPAIQPEDLSANHPFSGYGIFRSGWGPQDNYCLLKYGTTFIGRRESEKHPVISGHAHADALELELHYKGIPILVDPGTVGRYQDWDTYGGYCKATVAHNTVGLGNQWGYDRLDGLYAGHVKQLGTQFLYEREQNNIGRSDRELNAFGDAGQLGIISARLKTYDDATQQRTLVWFRDSGVTIVNDHMESGVEQPYEWYLNPIGRLISRENDDKSLTFGDDVAKLDVVPILPKDETIQILSKGDPKVPPYYLPLRPAGEQHQVTNMGKIKEPTDRWARITLLVLKKNAATTDFLNVLIPYEKTPAHTRSPMGSKGVRLASTDSTLLVAAEENDDPSLTVNGGFGFARLDHGKLSSYGLCHGHDLALGKQALVKVELLNKNWTPYFDSTVTAAVSLKDHRASFSFQENPMGKGLIINPPRVEPGKEPTQPIQVSVSFQVNEKPKRIISLHSSTRMPKLDDPDFDRKTAAWENDLQKGHYLRQPLDFTYNEENKTLTVTLDTGIRQLVWE